MAAYGENKLGNQIFVTLHSGKVGAQPAACCDIRVHYHETVTDIKVAVAAKLGVPVISQQLFWHNQELTARHDATTLLELGLHTGFCLRGYDLRVTPVYWPPVRQTDDGLQIIESG